MLVLDSLMFISLSLSFSNWCDQNWTHYSRDSLKSDELRGIITTLAKAAQYVVSLHHHYSVTLTFSLLSTRTRRPFSGLLLLHPHICFCWASACSSLLTPPVCWGPCERPACPLAYQIPSPKGGVIQELADGVADGAFCLTAQLADER